MRRKFHLSYSEKYKKNYVSKYLPTDRSLSNKDYFKKLKNLNFLKIIKKMYISKKLSLG